jgi:hypothetical protein
VSDSHADEMKKSRRVTSRGNGGFIDAQSGKYPMKEGAGAQQYLAALSESCFTVGLVATLQR